MGFGGTSEPHHWREELVGGVNFGPGMGLLECMRRTLSGWAGVLELTWLSYNTFG